MQKQLFHVLTLTPRQQAALGLLMQDFYSKYIQSYMAETMVRNDEKFIRNKTAFLQGAFRTYCDIRALLCSRETLNEGKTKMLRLNELGIQSLIKAVEFFDEHNHNVDHSDLSFIRYERDGLNNLLLESAKHKYTEEEVRRANGG